MLENWDSMDDSPTDVEAVDNVFGVGIRIGVVGIFRLG